MLYEKSLLLHLAGPDVQELFEDLVDPGVPAEQADDDDQFKKALRIFKAHFEVPPNTPYERHLFCQISFQDGETCDHFTLWYD